MQKLWGRLWAGIVAGVTGAAIGLVAMVLIVTMGFDLTIGLWALVILVVLGFFAGLAAGDRKLSR